jgi:hypothetical protein
MNRILHWLTAKLSRSTFAGESEQRDSDREQRGAGKEDQPGEPVTVSNVQTDIDDSTADIYDEATDDIPSDGDTQPNLVIIENPPETSAVTESFDPYNSGSYRALKK